MGKSWHATAKAALRDVVHPDEWTDDDGDLRRAEDAEIPGWVVTETLWGHRLRLEWGCLTFECDVDDDFALAARRLRAAAKAWGEVTP